MVLKKSPEDKWQSYWPYKAFSEDEVMPAWLDPYYFIIRGTMKNVS